MKQLVNRSWRFEWMLKKFSYPSKIHKPRRPSAVRDAFGYYLHVYDSSLRLSFWSMLFNDKSVKIVFQHSPANHEQELCRLPTNTYARMTIVKKKSYRGKRLLAASLRWLPTFSWKVGIRQISTSKSTHEHFGEE